VSARPFARAFAVLALLVALLGASATPAEAHAVLVRSLPASQSGLLASPGSIDLWFSEPLEAEFSRFELLASDGNPLRLDGMRIDPADGQHLSAFPLTLAPGIYTVVYRTFSTRDGHEWSGAFTFTVLNEDGTVPSGTAFTPDLGEGNSPQEVVGRWFTFTALALVLGGALVLMLVRREERAFREAATALYLRLSLAAMPLAIAGSIFQLNAQHEALGGSLRTLLTESRFGTFWLWRGAAVVALTAVLLALSRRRARQRPALLIAPPLLASAALLTVTMLSHAAAAPGRAWAIPVDFAHLELAAAWVGGLLLLAVLFVRAPHGSASDGAANDSLLRLVARYSVFAAAALYALGTTGVIRAIGELPTIAAVTGTGYGRWLLVKLALLLPVLLVALFNRRLLARWTEGASGAADATRRLRRMLPLEATLAVVVLFAVAVLGQVPTARGGDVAQTATAVAIPFNRIEQVGGLNLHLQVTPAQVGINELRVHLYRSDGSDPGRIEQVRLNLNATLGTAAGDQLDTEPQGDGIFTASAVFASFSRTWEVTVDVRREGFDDTRTQFSVPVQGGGTGGDGSGIFGSPAPQLDINIVWALLLMIGGVGVLVSIRRSRTTRGQTIRWAAVGAVFVAGALVVSAQQHLHGVTPQTAPNAGDPISIARGELLFTANCATCHGADGRGDGPSAAGLVPPPADFIQHIPLHSDASIFAFVSGGLPGTAMPAWGEQLTEQQIWDLVSYLQSEFGEGTRALTSPLPTVVASATPSPSPTPAATSTATATTTTTPAPSTSPSPTVSPGPTSTPTPAPATATPTPLSTSARATVRTPN
jgi:copper transport protein